MPWVSIGASLGSSLLSSSSASKAAKRQAEAAQAAANKITGAFEEGKALQMPFYQGGADAFSQLMSRLPQLTASYDPNKLTQEPGYQFGLNQGQQALEGSLAAKGLTDSGAALKAASRYGTDYATTKLNDAFNRDRASRNDAFTMLTGTAGFGERAGTNIATQGNQTAGRVADLMVGGANAKAANDVAQGNIWGNLLNYGGSLMKPKTGGNVSRAARALGLAELIGSIVPGKQADLTAVRLDAIETQPIYHVASQLVYATGRQQVSDVWIAGRRKLDNRALVGMDLAGIRAKAREWHERIAFAQ